MGRTTSTKIQGHNLPKRFRKKKIAALVLGIFVLFFALAALEFRARHPRRSPLQACKQRNMVKIGERWNEPQSTTAVPIMVGSTRLSIKAVKFGLEFTKKNVLNNSKNEYNKANMVLHRYFELLRW